jgi:transcriptional regulator with XRE-family HTH domain
MRARGLTLDDVAVLGRVDPTTISRIRAGNARAAPQTIVRLARALGISARRIARLCDQPWRDRTNGRSARSPKSCAA